MNVKKWFFIFSLFLFMSCGVLEASPVTRLMFGEVVSTDTEKNNVTFNQIGAANQGSNQVTVTLLPETKLYDFEQIQDLKPGEQIYISFEEDDEQHTTKVLGIQKKV